MHISADSYLLKINKEYLTMPKKVLIALPAAMLEEVDTAALTEHRTRSDLIREALRRYLEEFKRRQVQLIHSRDFIDKSV